MKWFELKPADAKQETAIIMVNNNTVESSMLESNLNDSMKELRKLLLVAWHDACKKAEMTHNNSKISYYTDLYFALNLYYILSKGKFAMNIRDAANCNIWRFISLKVVPEIILQRWRGKNLEDRYYRKPNRIYLKVLWWYIYLSEQDDMNQTENILKNNTTDIVVQLVERSGQHGYRRELYRKIMYKYAEINRINTGKMDPNLFRKVMKLHTARLVTIEPSMAKGGITGYVEELFDYFS